MPLTLYNTFSLKARTFLAALEALCKEHQVLLTVSGHDGLQLWDFDSETGEPWHCNGLEDRTVPDAIEDGQP